ncbi:M42 family metallopeptidase [Fonticella tunisiensis]|uniref:Endoglucanase n=1 Tax=Fonticella tunisiensis TaxID=1096341 RepID=A0A4R7KS69_9CLOT|nr:M42 family metallopeptidase [Fonticella tunisiensis]TDT60932.1 endoglucanase [Fonticella tunisiensis]
MELLKKLTEAFGPSGNEDEIAEVIIGEIKNYVDQIRRDRLGNVIAIKKGKGIGKIMVSAHMDQIGVMVTSIDKNGFLRFTDIGYVSPYTSVSQTVVFKNGVEGIVSREEKKEIKDVKLGDMYIDIGASSKEEALQRVNIGDFGVFKSNFVVNGDRISTGALDDRVGCYAAIEAAKRLKETHADVYFVFTVQEESYLSGAATSAYAIEPDCAIVIDVTDTGDTPNCHPMALKLGEGAAIKIMDRGMISHPKVKNFLIDIAKNHNIKYQLEVLEGGATDGAEIHVSRAGVPTGAISIPTRYIHSPQEMVDIKDVNGAIELLVKALEEYRGF